jgi:nucleoside-diphosphate-sugar epimerase
MTSDLKVCITGASGFLGSWTTKVLADDFEVVAITRPDSSLERLQTTRDINIVSEDAKNWPALVNDINPDVLIMHDWAGVGNSDRNNSSQNENLGRIHSFVSSLRTIKNVIGVGSQAELGPRNREILETDPSNPTTEYGRAKRDTRELLTSYFQNTETNFKWARIFSTYGAMDNGDWLIPNLVRSLSLEKPFPLTLGIQEWNYLHAYDAACAFKELARQGTPGVYNIADLDTYSIRDVCIEIVNLMGKDSELLKFGEVPMRPDQVYKLDVSTEKLRGLGWKPAVSLTQGLIHTIDSILESTDKPLKLNNGSLFTV